MVAPVREPVTDTALVEEILRLKRQRNAIILAHNYQIGPIQDLADFVGDSLGLAQKAARTDAPTIVFCGVHFMAETAAILSPEKRVLLPDLEAGCSLAESITAEELRTWKAEHPGAVVVSYVNTSAEVKAESDYCCTSGNAVRVVEAIPPDREILFLPDMFLGTYVQRLTGRQMHLWWGECHVHGRISPGEIARKREEHAGAEMLVHPECGCVTACMTDLADGVIDPKGVHLLSTEGMMRHVDSSSARDFVVVTEVGVLHRLRQAHPGKRFYPVSDETSCQFMKMITLEKLYRSLRDDVYPVTVPPEIADRARLAVARMIAL